MLSGLSLCSVRNRLCQAERPVANEVTETKCSSGRPQW